MNILLSTVLVTTMLCVTLTKSPSAGRCRCGYTIKGVNQESIIIKEENAPTADIKMVAAYTMNETFPGDVLILKKKKNRSMVYINRPTTNVCSSQASAY